MDRSRTRVAGLLSAAVIHTEQRLQFLRSSCFPSDGRVFCGGKGRRMPQRRDVPFAMSKGTCGSHITKVSLFKSQQQRSTMALKSQETGSDPVAITVNTNINTIFLQPHVNSGCCYATLSAHRVSVLVHRQSATKDCSSPWFYFFT